MEKQIALVNKTTKRIENVLIVDSLDKDKIKAWETDQLEVIPVKGDSAYLNGLWDGENFIPPTEDYLIEIGLVQPVKIELIEPVELVDNQTDLG
jgi:hypothetical protein